MTDAEIRAAADRFRQTYDTGLSDLLSRIWGGHLHMGLFDHPDELLLPAQMRANAYMAQAAGLKAGDTVIETACGVGGTARFLAAGYGVGVVATNITEAQLSEGRDLTNQAGLSDLVTFHFADYHHLPFPDASFDCWWCQEALLYSTDKRRVVEEAIRVTRPGGRLIMSDLVLQNSLTGPAREAFTGALKAPNMWATGQWDALLDTVPLGILDRQEWDTHTTPTFTRVLAELLEVREEFTRRIGREAVDGTIDRVTMQLAAARAGHLGWCCFAMER